MDSSQKKRNKKASDKIQQTFQKVDTTVQVSDGAVTLAKTSSTTKTVFVDDKMSCYQQYSVCNNGEAAMSCYLMWSDLKHNHNKFYIAQGLRHSNGSYVFWTRYGRVGVDGVGTPQQCASLDALIKTYVKKTNEKKKKGYTEVKMAIGKEEEKKEEEKKDKLIPDSKLDQSVQDLINFIFDKKMIEESVVKVGYDPHKLPLGQLDKETINMGYKYLRKIEKVLQGKKKGDLEELSSKFYTYIPHKLGHRNIKEFTINTIDKLKDKLDLIQNLTDIQIAHKISEPTMSQQTRMDRNPIDENYDKLKCEIKTLTNQDEDFKMISKYLENSRNGRRLKLMDCFKIDREGESGRYNPNKLSNKKLLWHGSRFSNFVGILSQGLRIAPPEAPKTGYLFGKGVYLADLADKSAPYTCSNLSNNVGLFLLCEAALGNPRVLTQPDQDADNHCVPPYNSTQCNGKNIPDPADLIKLDNEVVVPYGKVVQNPNGNYMGHNEFIVYNVNQVKMRYLVKVKFD